VTAPDATSLVWFLVAPRVETLDTASLADIAGSGTGVILTVVARALVIAKCSPRPFCPHGKTKTGPLAIFDGHSIGDIEDRTVGDYDCSSCTSYSRRSILLPGNREAAYVLLPGNREAAYVEGRDAGFAGPLTGRATSSGVVWSGRPAVHAVFDVSRNVNELQVNVHAGNMIVVDRVLPTTAELLVERRQEALIVLW
jgi:hypothetical protein